MYREVVFHKRLRDSMKQEARVYERASQKGLISAQKLKDHVNIQFLFSFVLLVHARSF